MTEGHVVAVWVGDFDDYTALDEYLGEPFEQDYGFLLNERSLPEMSEPDGRTLEIRELLTGFSWSEDWIDEAVRVCHERGFRAAKAAAVFYHLRYRPELCSNPQAPLRFVANVSWNTERPSA